MQALAMFLNANEQKNAGDLWVPGISYLHCVF
jgi:hypothetical protein